MQRVVIYLKRRTDLLQPVFFDWWLGQHRALAEQLPGLRQYLISLAADAQDEPFDASQARWSRRRSSTREVTPLRRWSVASAWSSISSKVIARPPPTTRPAAPWPPGGRQWQSPR